MSDRDATQEVLPRHDAPAIELLLDTSATVIRHRADDPVQAWMHRTVVGLFVDFDRAEAVWGHAGDSRLYLFRKGRVLLHTHDHAIVQSLADDAELRGTLAVALHPQAWLAELERCVLRHAAGRRRPRHDNFSALSVWIGAAATRPGAPAP